MSEGYYDFWLSCSNQVKASLIFWFDIQNIKIWDTHTYKFQHKNANYNFCSRRIKIENYKKNKRICWLKIWNKLQFILKFTFSSLKCTFIIIPLCYIFPFLAWDKKIESERQSNSAKWPANHHTYIFFTWKI